jgi:hypothetical protein
MSNWPMRLSLADYLAASTARGEFAMRMHLFMAAYEAANPLCDHMPAGF